MDWKTWTQGLVAAMPRDGGEGAIAALTALQARLAARGPGATQDTHAQAALGVLAWRIATHGPAAARSGRTPLELLDLAVTAAVAGGERDDIATAYVLRASLAETNPAEQRRLLLEANDRTAHGHHAPFVMLARIDLAEERFGDAAGNLAAAEQILRTRTDAPWLRAEFFETRARLHLLLGLPDLVARDTEEARAAGLSPARDALLHLHYALSIEDFGGALRLGDAILAEHPSLDRAEILLLMARAHARDPEPQTARPTPRTLAEQALGAATTPAVRARALIELAMLALDDGDIATGASRLAAADAERVAVDPARAFGLDATAGVARARLALAGDDAAALGSTRAELLRVRDRLFDQWRSMPLRPGGLGFLQFGERRDVLAALIAVEHRLAPAHPERALQHLLDAQALGTLARRLAHDAGSAADVQRLLAPADGGILVFLPTVFGECSFVITRDAIGFHVLPRSDRLLADLRAFRRALLADDRGPGVTAALQARGRALLSQILPPDALDQLRTWRACAIVGRELLAKLPFEALPGFDAAWLGVEKDLWYLPSLPFGLERARARGSRPAPERDCVVVAATRDEPGPQGQPALRIADAEVRAVVDAWSRRDVLVALRADRAALQGQDLLHTDLLWMLGHGSVVDTTATDERPIAMAMADGYLRCADIDAWPRGRVPPVIALSVCGGESGPPRRGDDTGGHLAGAFLAAGADAVLASDTDLRIDGHLALVRALHDALAEGDTLARALRRARMALVSAGGEFAHPRHHAWFSIFGLGDVVVRAAPARSPLGAWLVAAGAMVLACGLGAAIALRRRAPTPDRPAGHRPAAGPAAAVDPRR